MPETAALRRAVVQILAAALGAVDAYTATTRAFRLEGDTLLIGGRPFPLPSRGRVIVVGAGKACGPMARAVEDILEDRVTAGLVVVRTGYTTPLRRITLREAGHPLPDPAGEAAAKDRPALSLSNNDLRLVAAPSRSDHSVVKRASSCTSISSNLEMSSCKSAASTWSGCDGATFAILES